MSYRTDNFDERVIELLATGGVGLIPSDTIYGLSGRALDGLAVEKLRKIKGRSAGKPFIILFSNYEMLDLLSIDREEVSAAKKYWPGPLTMVVNAPKAPFWLLQNLTTLAIRIPGNPELRQLIDETGPIVSTSANMEGQTPAVSAEEAWQAFGDKLDFYVDSGQLSGKPSTIVKLSDGRLQVNRPGAVKID